MKKMRTWAAQATRIGDSFECPYCGAEPCAFAKVDPGFDHAGETIALHPMPPCRGYVENEILDILRAVNAKREN